MAEVIEKPHEALSDKVPFLKNVPWTRFGSKKESERLSHFLVYCLNTSSSFGASIGIVLSPYLWNAYGLQGVCCLWVIGVSIASIFCVWLWRKLRYAPFSNNSRRNSGGRNALLERHEGLDFARDDDVVDVH